MLNFFFDRFHCIDFLLSNSSQLSKKVRIPSQTITLLKKKISKWANILISVLLKVTFQKPMKNLDLDLLKGHKNCKGVLRYIVLLLSSLGECA